MGEPEPQLATVKDRFDLLLAIHDRHRDRFEKRRSYEWKIAFGFYTLLVAVGALLYTGQLASDSVCVRLLLALTVFLASFFYVGMWVRECMKRHEDDRELSKIWFKHATSLVLGAQDEAVRQDLTSAVAAFEKKRGADDLHRGRYWFFGIPLLNPKNSWFLEWGAMVHTVITAALCVGIALGVCCQPSRMKQFDSVSGSQNYEIKYSATQPAKGITTSLQLQN
jgi:uncharacterized membrane protein (DUF485 family)